MPYYLGCIRVYTKWYNYRKSKCKNMGEEENWMPSHETKLFYISDFEKYLEKPITTGVDENGKVFAKISGHRRKDGWIEQSSSQEVEIKTRWFIKLKKDTKDNVERAVLKELVRNRGGEVIFKEIKHQVEYNNIVEYNAKFDEMIKSQRGVNNDEIS